MILLPDVNVMIALAHQGHAEHDRVSAWYATVPSQGVTLATCSVCELGFVRVSVQAGLEATIPDAVNTLNGMIASSSVPFRRLADDSGAADLPSFVKRPKQVNGGHLSALARKHGGRLATLDRGIGGSFFIP